MNNFDKIRFYDDPHAQIDGGAECSVTNNVDILQYVIWYDEINKLSLYMRGDTSVKLKVPMVEGLL